MGEARRDPWQLAVFRVSIRKREKWAWIERALRQHELPRGRCLDVGCGVGTLSVLLEQMGGTWTFLEPDERAAQEARAVVRSPVATTTMEAQHYPEASFDLVTAFDVLEHTEHPQTFVNEVARVVRPGGFFVFTTPADEGALYLWRVLGAQLFHITREAHGHVVDGFSRAQLEALLARAACTPREISEFSKFFTEAVEVAYNGAYRMKNVRRQTTTGYNLALSPASSEDVQRHAWALPLLRLAFPLTRGFSLLDHVFPAGRGYEYGVVAQKES